MADPVNAQSVLESFIAQDPSDVQHYGVKGMKWGKRKAKVTYTKAGGGGGIEDDPEKLKKELEEIVSSSESGLDAFSRLSDKRTEYYNIIRDRKYKNKKEFDMLESQLKIIDNRITKVFDDHPDNLATKKKKSKKSQVKHSSDSLASNILESFISQTPSDVQHHGVLGMKWGRRKSRDGSYKDTDVVLREEKSNSKSAKSGSRDVAKRTNTLKNNRNNRRMSDGELKATIKRLEDERTLARLLAERKPQDPRVKRFIKEKGPEVLENVVFELSKAYLKKYVGVTVNNKLKEPYRIST